MIMLKSRPGGMWGMESDPAAIARFQEVYHPALGVVYRLTDAAGDPYFVVLVQWEARKDA